MPSKNIHRVQKMLISYSELGVKALIYELTAMYQVSNSVFSVSSYILVLRI